MATKVNVISYGERKGMYMEGTALKGKLFNLYGATSVGPDVDGSALTDGSFMFRSRSNLTSFTTDLPNLTNGYYMFCYCHGLISFSGDLPSLTSAVVMFEDCNNLISFSGDLSSLVNGTSMFSMCSKLTSFSGALSALDTGVGMFNSCKLDNNSLQNIVTTIKSWDSGTHNIGIGVDSNLVTQAQQDEADAILRGKGWTVIWKRN